MNGRKTLRSIGAVALSVAVGMGFSTSAHAVKLVTTVDTDPGADSVTEGTVFDSITYAKETLPTAQNSGMAAGYHSIARDHFVAGRTTITAEAGDTYYVVYNLTGMVFDGDTQAVLGGGTSATWRGIKGMKGDTQVAFRLTAGSVATGADGADTNLVLTAKFAIGPG